MRTTRARAVSSLLTLLVASTAGCVAADAGAPSSSERTGSVRQAISSQTSFDPKVDMFGFGNEFKDFNHLPAGLDFRSGGLCGGMTYAALDYWNAHVRMPNQDYRPAEGTALQSYIYARQFESLSSNVDRWAELTFNPFGARNREFFNWGLQGGPGGRITELQSFIDRGIPVPLGLKGTGGTGDHQVLAYGYDTGRYQGDLGAFETDFKILVADPNFPGETRTLVPFIQGSEYFYTYAEELSDFSPTHRWITYFVDANYSARIPPNLQLPTFADDGLVHELLVQAWTGSDDMRGGPDDVDLTVVMNDGTTIPLGAINGGNHWISNYDQTVRMPLPSPVRQADIARLTFADTFSGGTSGDNWDMNQLSIWAVGYVGKWQIGQSGFHRFQADDESRTLSIVPSGQPVLPPPVANYLFPSAGPPLGGGVVRIDGDNFDINGNTQVYFGGVLAGNVSCPSPIQCFATAPPGDGSQYVNVVVNGVSSPATPGTAYDYAPSIASVYPAVGNPGDTVMVYGIGLPSGATTLDFGGVVASNVLCDGGVCSAIVPGGVGNVEVHATVQGVRSASNTHDSFQFSGPLVTFLSLPDGPLEGGSFLVVNGSGFDTNSRNVQVLFNGTPGNYVNCDYPTSCTVYSPAMTMPGPVDVQVEAFGVTSPKTSADVFTYDPFAKIASFTVLSGVVTVQLNGYAPANGAVVSITSSDASVLAATTVTIPAGASSAQLTLPLQSPSAAETLTVTASYQGSTSSLAIGVTPAPPPPPISLSAGTDMTSNSTESAVVTLASPAPAGGALVTLTSSSSGAWFTVPPSVTVGAGATQATFLIAAHALGKIRETRITATYGGNQATVAVDGGSLVSGG